MPRLVNIPYPIDLPIAGRTFKLRPGMQSVSDEIAKHWMIIPFWAKDGESAAPAPEARVNVAKTAAELKAEAEEAARVRAAEEERKRQDELRAARATLEGMLTEAQRWADQLKADPGNPALREAAVKAADAARAFAKEKLDEELELAALPPVVEVKAPTEEDRAAAAELLKPLLDAVQMAAAALQKLSPNTPKPKRDAALKAVQDARAAAEARAKELGVPLEWPTAK